MKHTAKEFVDGEQFLFLGKYYGLQINNSENRNIVFKNAFILEARNREVVKNLMFEWYQQQAKEVLIPRIKYFAEHLGVKRKRINIISPKYTWGSCTAAGTLNFNWRIVKSSTRSNRLYRSTRISPPSGAQSLSRILEHCSRSTSPIRRCKTMAQNQRARIG